MSTNWLPIALLLAIGLVLAIGLINTPPPAQGQIASAGGRYHVVAGDKAFVLYDVEDSKKSWLLVPAATGKRHAWMPVERLDTEAEMHKWRLLKNAGQ